ncbi:zinc-binding dehydrogenase [Streptomyces sp. So13.3]|uniref:zinc-binding dehydrogenase n=1 Tax=Streptomyces TaxID=1883 RepID=UPI001105794F|nr:MULTISPECIES: zinc-binding dehydrogenase [Streptomyces]MCZ4098674.1 zinc-binding dehydrogenase [Streptomyces sp. H39-C1]QNA76242.1 zinc-binding dehydrogenase [Streptomyces sp. So13.3]
MKATVIIQGRLELVDLPAPRPRAGQLLLDVRRCGICGSDLHARLHGDELADTLDVCGYPRYMRSEQRVVMGHEIYGEVVEYGPWTSGRIKPGTPVVAVPLVRYGHQVDGIGLSADAPGGYGEQVVVQESLTLPVPNGLRPDIAALTEPMAVAWHAVNRGDVTRKDTAIVLGCGPVGLAVISVLKSRGVATVIASDYSAGRRALAKSCGADIVVDPSVETPWKAMGDGHGFMTTMPEEYGAGIDAIESMQRLPVPWWVTWRALDKVGVTRRKRPVVFECVGVPGMLDGVMAAAPLHSRVVVVGVCMGSDTIRPSLAVNKELDLRFVVGYTPLEFRDTLHALADGTLDASHLVTGRVGLAGVNHAFTALADPEAHAKIVIDPTIETEQILTT